MDNNIIFWNCCGGIGSKIDYIKDFMTQNGPSLFFISESEIKEPESNLFKIEGYELIHSNNIGFETKARLSIHLSNTNRSLLRIKLTSLP